LQRSHTARGIEALCHILAQNTAKCLPVVSQFEFVAAFGSLRIGQNVTLPRTVRNVADVMARIAALSGQNPFLSPLQTPRETREIRDLPMRLEAHENMERWEDLDAVASLHSADPQNRSPAEKTPWHPFGQISHLNRLTKSGQCE
jgi:hypothetical protein